MINVVLLIIIVATMIMVIINVSLRIYQEKYTGVFSAVNRLQVNVVIRNMVVGSCVWTLITEKYIGVVCVVSRL